MLSDEQIDSLFYRHYQNLKTFLMGQVMGKHERYRMVAVDKETTKNIRDA
ncbi:hypothetical protein [Brevibacillus massiliensis]|nr:hypothetical protein [Brevibacillus massiliensis]